MKKIVIFLESYNDIDNILPFIDYLLFNNMARVVLYKTDRTNLNGCEEHLNYLKNTYSLIPLSFDENFSKLYKLFFNFYRKFRTISLKAKKKSFFILFPVITSRILRPIMLHLSYSEVVKHKEILNSDVIMMDEGKEGSFFAFSFVKIFKNTHTSIVGFTHGFTIYTNPNPQDKDLVDLSTVKKIIMRLAKPRVKKSYFDRYAAVPGQKKTFYSTSMLNFDHRFLNRVSEIGSLRYTHEWVCKYREDILNAKFFSYGSVDKLNVVLFMSNPRYNVNVSELMETIKKLSKFENINFVYKPHTRSLMEGVDVHELNGYDATAISSIELSSWADVGIVYGSSIAFQLIIDNVPIIMPTYVHKNTTILEENNACIVVDNASDMMNILSYSILDINNMIDQTKIDYVINKYVYGGKSYVEFMNEFYNLVVRDKR